MPSPAKKVKLLSDFSSSEDESDDGVRLQNGDSQGFKINEEFARRFEHNKKREEQHRLEEKLKPNRKRSVNDSEDEDSDESTDESEDDNADLATKALDSEIFATLAAIKNKDPKVYDKNVKFYKDWENEASNSTAKEKKEKPMYLQDYHRQQLMAGITDEEDDAQKLPPMTHEQEQAALRRQMVGEMHAAQNDQQEESSDDEMFKVKSRPKHSDIPDPESKLNPARARQITNQDVLNADKDPENYLSNFMVSRAWLPKEDWRFQGQEFDSDDSEEERRADAFENAYNMRFEDPTTANEKLKTFSRDAAAKSSVRREDVSGRKRAREQERERKEAEKEERRRERDRLKKLKMDEMEEKVNRIKEAAGLGKDEELDLNAWRSLLEGDFADDDWDAAMRKRFDEQYYAERDPGLKLDLDRDAGKTNKKSKPKKPQFDDDIDIRDIVPDFEDNFDEKPAFTLSSDDEEHGPGVEEMDIDQAEVDEKKHKSHKERKQEAIDAKRAARKERAKIETLVDSSLPLAHPHLVTSSKKAPVAGFKYRETSPTSFGLTARDILFASDADLNSYAGLKKMTAFREEERKDKDRKKFSKKARLRQWRKDTFGKPDEPVGGFETLLGESGEVANGSKRDSEANGKRKRKRSSKKATTATSA
ncbi:Krr1-domain-containing protein [Polychaeton citri CBS 116435]|uniref:Krr1-domain-containing protein n=1 Tax=Polychaeton citri CBS 116435 TaxID=1314669 RepID=A0A9P4UPE4_9PEZI|nr:Krr1-domain-containing protein [Polychaeton citri CBS 116435]